MKIFFLWGSHEHRSELLGNNAKLLIRKATVEFAPLLFYCSSETVWNTALLLVSHLVTRLDIQCKCYYPIFFLNFLILRLQQPLKVFNNPIEKPSCYCLVKLYSNSINIQLFRLFIKFSESTASLIVGLIFRNHSIQTVDNSMAVHRVLLDV